MVWQFVVLPGTHTVTVVNRVLTSGLALVGPASTTMSATLEPVGVELPDANDALLPPPPQESTGQQRAAHSPKRHARHGVPMGVSLIISANLLRSHRRARPAAGTRGPRRRAYARPPARRDCSHVSARDDVPSAGLSPPSRSYRSTVPESGADSARWGRSTRPQTPCRRILRTRAPGFRRATGFRAADSSHAVSL